MWRLLQNIMKTELNKKAKGTARIARLFAILFLFSICLYPASAVNAANPSATHKGAISETTKGFFDLVSLAEVIFAPTNTAQPNTNLKAQQKQNFINAAQKFTQGNITVSYDEYLNLVMSLKNDFALLNLSKSLYEVGFFSLADLALSKIEKRELLESQIEDLKHSYAPSTQLSKDEEIYLAKAFSNIYYDNCAQEASFELNKKTVLVEKSDYANYILAQSMFELRQYQQALNYIEIALSKNPQNSSYKFYKTKILFYAQNYKEVIRYIEKNEKTISLNFKHALMIYKQNAIANMPKENKKFRQAYASYLEGNYYKAIKECQHFDKKAYMEYALLGKSYLKLGHFQEAVKNFEMSYKMNKSYAPTLMGLGDIEFLSEQYTQSLEYYKKAHAADKNNVEVLLKLSLVSEALKDEKSAGKYDVMARKLDSRPFFEEYEIASTLLAGNAKSKYLRKSISTNIFFEDSWNETIALAVNNNQTRIAENMLFVTSFATHTSFKRYYSMALVDAALEKYDEAAKNLRYALNLNPEFEDASKFLVRLEYSPGENI